MPNVHSRWIAAAAAALALGCGGSGAARPGDATPTPVVTTPEPRAGADTADQSTIPAGYGTLRQDDMAVKIGSPSVQVQMIPLEESFIRLLAPDSYRSMRETQEGHRQAIDDAARRFNVRRPSLWLVRFYGVVPDARFTPRDITIQSAGREFRPLDVLPLSSGFGEERLRQREVQSAIYVFEEGINLTQPLTVTYQQTRNTNWEQNLRLIERERALVRSRARPPANP